jgi:hypothetical protein
MTACRQIERRSGSVIQVSQLAGLTRDGLLAEGVGLD